MPSLHTVQAFQVNETLNLFHVGPLILKWLPKDKKCILDTGEATRRCILGMALWKIAICFYYLFALTFCTLNPRAFDIEHLVISGFIFQAPMSSLLTNFLLSVYGVEMMRSFNWALQTENIWSRHFMERAMNQVFWTKSGLVVNRNPEKGRVGTVVLIFCVMLSFCAICIPFVSVIMDWDPLVICGTVLKDNNYLDANIFELICFRKIGKIFRCLVLSTLVHSCVADMKSLLICGLVAALCLVNMQNILLSRPISKDGIALYKQMSLQRVCLREYEKSAITGIILVTFSCLVLSCNAIQIGTYLKDPIVSAAAGLVAVVNIGILMGFLECCCGIHEKSLQLLDQWKKQVGLRQDKRYMVRQFKSFNVLFVPCGHVGKMDMEMKTTYLESASETTLNLMIALKEFIRY